MLITQQLLDELTAKAKESPRLRTAYDLRTTPNDNSQRILNAVEPGTILPIHRHRTTTETIVVLRGRVRQSYYDDKCNVTDSFELAPMSGIVGMCVPVGQWHALESLASGTIILAIKDGAYAPLTDEDILQPTIHANLH